MQARSNQGMGGAVPGFRTRTGSCGWAAVRRGCRISIALLVALVPIAAAQGETRIDVRRDAVLGDVLVDGVGRTLYTYEGDAGGVGSCRGPCLADWLPLHATGGPPSAPPGLSQELALIPSDGGRYQVAYQGRPLYASRRDTAPGAANGHGADRGRWLAVNAGPTVRVHEHPRFGEILVGPTGMTLYTYDHDEPNDIYCDDGCSENWPPLVVAAAPLVPPGLEERVDLTRRLPDEFRPERIQVRYRGRPLYYWSRDVAPGDVTGHGIAGLWSVARP